MVKARQSESLESKAQMAYKFEQRLYSLQRPNCGTFVFNENTSAGVRKKPLARRLSLDKIGAQSAL
jgi:hypothetical protein